MKAGKFTVTPPRPRRGRLKETGGGVCSKNFFSLSHRAFSHRREREPTGKMYGTIRMIFFLLRKFSPAFSFSPNRERTYKCGNGGGGGGEAFFLEGGRRQCLKRRREAGRAGATHKSYFSSSLVREASLMTERRKVFLSPRRETRSLE